jgi:hypothetical protein
MGKKLKTCILDLLEGMRVTKRGVGEKWITEVSKGRSCGYRKEVSARNCFCIYILKVRRD